MGVKFTTKSKQYLIGIFFAILSCAGGFFLLFFITKDTFSAVNNLFLIPLFIGLIYFYTSVFKPKGKLLFWVLSVFFSLIMVLGFQLENYSNIFFSFGTIVKILTITFVFYPIFWLMARLFMKINNTKKFNITKKQKLIAFLTIFIVGLIIWILLFPGIYTYDMASQNEMISKGIYTSHWSLVYGSVLGFFLNAGMSLFGSYNIGFAIFTFIQMSFISYVSYRIVYKATEISKNKVVFVASTLFFCLVPFLPVLAVTDAQDVAFGGLSALFIIYVFDMFCCPDFFKKKRNPAKVILLAFLMTTIRNNGVYCILFMVPFVFFFKNQNKWKILLTITIPIVCNFIYSGPIFNALGIQKPTTLNEILSVPSQQLARAYVYNQDSLSEEEIQEIERFYTVNEEFLSYEQYPLIADFTKKSLNNEEVSSNMSEYIALWLSIGIKRPGDYIEAFLLNSLGFWYPMKDYNDDRIKLDYMNYPGFSMTNAFESPKHQDMKRVERQIPDNILTKALDKIIFGNGWSSIPIISQLSSMGNYFAILIICIGIVIYKKRYEVFLVITPILGFMLTLLLAPVAIFRYIYPITLCVPPLISYIFYVTKNNKRKEKNNG